MGTEMLCEGGAVIGVTVKVRDPSGWRWTWRECSAPVELDNPYCQVSVAVQADRPIVSRIAWSVKGRQVIEKRIN